MPLVAWLIVRIPRAFHATLSLLTNRRIMKALPWAYIRRLPRHHLPIGLATATLATGAMCLLGAAALPHDAAAAAYQIGFAALAAGIAASWIRALRNWFHLRQR
jgi:hypothetical protein